MGYEDEIFDTQIKIIDQLKFANRIDTEIMSMVSYLGREAINARARLNTQKEFCSSLARRIHQMEFYFGKLEKEIEQLKK
jgi:hypothetical protein